MSSITEAFRVRPFMGRDVTAEDNETGRPMVVAVGYHYWRERLGGRMDVLGTKLELSALPYETLVRLSARQ